MSLRLSLQGFLSLSLFSSFVFFFTDFFFLLISFFVFFFLLVVGFYNLFLIISDSVDDDPRRGPKLLVNT